MPLLDEARTGKRKVYFVDAAHFVMAPFLGHLWSFARIFIKAPSGRNRFNVLGALDAITKELIIVTNEFYINAESIIQLLSQLANKWPDPSIPITLVLDNARYQKCKVVEAEAELLDIELLYLPAYSPNLNLIERLWKFVKKTCLYSEYYDTFDAFKKAISNCLEKVNTEYKVQLESFLSLKFQTFKKSQFIT